MLDKLHALKNEHGVVIGLSLSGDKQAETLNRALTVHREYDNLFGSVQATWNILERSAEDALKAAHMQGIGGHHQRGRGKRALNSEERPPGFCR